MAATTSLSSYSEQLGEDYSLAQYLQDAVSDANLILSQSMFFFPWNYILDNKSKQLLNILKELRDNASSNLLVENIETSKQAKRTFFDMQQQKPIEALKFLKDDGTDIKFTSGYQEKFGMYKYMIGAKYCKGHANAWLSSVKRPHGNFLPRSFSTVFYFFTDITTRDTFLSTLPLCVDTIRHIHAVVLTSSDTNVPYQCHPETTTTTTMTTPTTSGERIREVLRQSREQQQQLGTLRVGDSIRDALTAALEANIEPTIVEHTVERLEPHLSQERITGWDGLGNYLTEAILTRDDLSDTILVFDFDKTLTAPLTSSSSGITNVESQVGKLRGGSHTLEALQAAKEKGCTFYICTAAAGSGQQIKTLYSSLMNSAQYAVIANLFEQDILSPSVPHYLNVFSDDNSPVDNITEALMDIQLNVTPPKETKKLYFFDDFVGNVADVYLVFDGDENKFNIEELHSVWWDPKQEEDEGILIPSAKGGSDDSYNETIPVLVQWREGCAEGFVPRPHENPGQATLQTFNREVIHTELINHSTLTCSVPTLEYFLQDEVMELF